MSRAELQEPSPRTEEIRVRGTVQGVGFRPTVYRIATELGLYGDVANDGDGVIVRLRGAPATLDAFVHRLHVEKPPLAVIAGLERTPATDDPTLGAFAIAESASTPARTDVAPDAATCPACLAEVLDPTERRYRYPFANCTHCGPRFSIIRSLPYDRPATTMAAFPMCAACRREYEDPSDRRFHAQPVACHGCGPRAWLERADGRPFTTDAFSMMDDVDATCSLLQRGEIVAIKGVGGFHLACDATQEGVVAALRDRKRRLGKPFALMARDLDVVQRFVHVDAVSRAVLEGPAAPIVLLDVRGDGERVAPSVAPGHGQLGFMLPYTPLHQLLLRRMDRPIVLTSGNRSDEPQCIDDDEARDRLGGIATWFLFHDRVIENRVDDSVVRITGGEPRLLRRARGYAPAPLRLPPGFEGAPRVFAAGADLKSTFALVADGGRAIVSQHLGDLEHPSAVDAWGKTLDLLRGLFDQRFDLVAVDRHPEYVSRKSGRGIAAAWGLPVTEVQHHHAHVAACMAENGVALDDPEPVLGVALDGLGWGDDATIWGGELLLSHYVGAERLATFKPVAMLGGDRASREPWRNLYAHLRAEMGWGELEMSWGDVDAVRHLMAKPRRTLDAMLASDELAPRATSAGRLFDAVAAAVGFQRDGITYESQAAMELEAAVDEDALRREPEELAYPFSTPRLGGKGIPYLEPLAMWRALLGDLHVGTPSGVIAARFHRGLARGLRLLVRRARGQGDEPRFRRVALTGGVFQNRVLFEETKALLEADGLDVLTHRAVPAGDGGIALGQAAVAAARWLEAEGAPAPNTQP